MYSLQGYGRRYDVSGYSATVDDSGASVSDSFSEYEAAKF